MKRRRKTKARDKAWKQLSAEIRAKVGKCEMCGKSNDVLHAHHVIQKKSHPDLWLEENDLIVLCPSCHFKWHHGHDVEGIIWLMMNKPEQWEWIKAYATNAASPSPS